MRKSSFLRREIRKKCHLPKFTVILRLRLLVSACFRLNSIKTTLLFTFRLFFVSSLHFADLSSAVWWLVLKLIRLGVTPVFGCLWTLCPPFYSLPVRAEKGKMTFQYKAPTDWNSLQKQLISQISNRGCSLKPLWRTWKWINHLPVAVFFFYFLKFLHSYEMSRGCVTFCLLARIFFRTEINGF